MICELKITSGPKKLCKNFMVVRHCVEELLAKKVLRGHEIIEIHRWHLEAISCIPQINR